MVAWRLSQLYTFVSGRIAGCDVEGEQEGRVSLSEHVVTNAVVRRPVERETIRVGVIGAGFGASVHVPALRRVPGVTVAAICGAHAGRIRDVAAELEIPASYSDYRELFESGAIDAVTIATPPHLHHPVALAACEAGLHVLCEKPMARSVAEARDMLRMAREAGVCHAVAHQMRHDPARHRLKELLDDGFIGRLHSVSVMVYRSALADPTRRTSGWLTDAASAGGVLSAIGSHYIDALRWWFGDIHWVAGAVSTAIPERAVSGREGLLPVDADDNTAFVVRFSNGALGSVHISYTSAVDIGEEIIATGSDGVLIIQDNGRLFGARRGERIQNLLPAYVPGSGDRSGPARHIRAFSILVGEWILAMRTGAEASPSFDDGAKVQEVLDAVSRSQQLSRWIDLSGNKWPV
ncbi:MAG TPA: gfo/Idh/MocA family oxidoreductase [Chloroflexi bacterium]|nr:gfo/Idh/MocA family oxidoreductase [Chloroflexota bacterium]